MGNKGGASLTYTTSVTTVNPSTGETRTVTVVVTSSRPLSIGEIEGMVSSQIAAGEIEQREGSGRATLGGMVLSGFDLISVYQGAVI